MAPRFGNEKRGNPSTQLACRVGSHARCSDVEEQLGTLRAPAEKRLTGQLRFDPQCLLLLQPKSLDTKSRTRLLEHINLTKSQGSAILGLLFIGQQAKTLIRADMCACKVLRRDRRAVH